MCVGGEHSQHTLGCPAQDPFPLPLSRPLLPARPARMPQVVRLQQALKILQLEFQARAALVESLELRLQEAQSQAAVGRCSAASMLHMLAGLLLVVPSAGRLQAGASGPGNCVKGLIAGDAGTMQVAMGRFDHSLSAAALPCNCRQRRSGRRTRWARCSSCRPTAGSWRRARRRRSGSCRPPPTTSTRLGWQRLHAADPPFCLVLMHCARTATPHATTPAPPPAGGGVAAAADAAAAGEPAAQVADQRCLRRPEKPGHPRFKGGWPGPGRLWCCGGPRAGSHCNDS